MIGYCIFKLVFLVCAFTLATANVDEVNPDVVVKNVDRSVDVASQLVKTLTKVTFQNNGKVAVNKLLFTIEPEDLSYLAYIGAQLGDASKTSLKLSKSKLQGRVAEPVWLIDLKSALQPGKTVVVDVETVLTHKLVQYPTSITQTEKQLVLYHGNHYFYSPYPVSKQVTTVNVGTRNIENYTKQQPVSQSDTTVTYGPYDHIPPFTTDSLTIHYENNAPFLTVKSLVRVLEVSHWGNIAVEEKISLLHTGAVLKGPFSRYDYQKEAQGALSSVKSFKTILPAAANGAYYRDEIGNISTSHMKVLSDSVELDLRPRFPLFGGWKTQYVIGYNVPSYEYLYNAGDDYLLKMRFIDHIFDDMVVEELTTKIILPEGAHDFQLSTPYPVERLPNSLHYTYLDTKGRPVITLKQKNLVENHIQDFKLNYVFPRVLMLQEPFLVTVAFYLLFLLVIVYVRLDLSITKAEAGNPGDKPQVQQ